MVPLRNINSLLSSACAEVPYLIGTPLASHICGMSDVGLNYQCAALDATQNARMHSYTVNRLGLAWEETRIVQVTASDNRIRTVLIQHNGARPELTSQFAEPVMCFR